MPLLWDLMDQEVPEISHRFFIYLGALLLGIVTGALVLAFFMAGEIYDYQDTVDGVHLPEVDAVVCLAGGRGRIAEAGDLWYRYWELNHAVNKATGKSSMSLPVLYISGMGKNANWAVFTKQLRRGVRDVIKPENVVIENESLNTDANARWLARYGNERDWSRILLMTSPYHMKRARFIFEGVLRPPGPSIEVETLSVFQEPFEANEWRSNLHGIRVSINEYIKWIYYKNFWHAY
jgi:uncharacterized SAM-binding protein YcdF (DUF218 family)